MAYLIRFTDPEKEAIVVEDNTIDQSTGLVFPGRNSTGYGQLMAENFLHLLENFADNEPPVGTAVEGQLWYDNTEGIQQLKIYNGTEWLAAGGLRKGPVEPSPDNSLPGDLWANTDTQQLFLYSGSGWSLVGPRFGAGLRTGAEPEVILDATNVQRSIVSQYVEGERVAIISKDTFIPRVQLAGFETGIKSGVNLSTLVNNNSPYFYWGTAEKALKLYVTGGPADGVSADKFLRVDVESTVEKKLKIRNNDGLTVGAGDYLQLFVDGPSAVIQNINPGNLNLKISLGGSDTAAKTLVSLSPSGTGRVGIGLNNTNPQETLDVAGNIITTGTIKSLDTTESTSATTGSLLISGGAGISGNLNVSGTIGVSSQGVALGGPVVPVEDDTISLGTSIRRFNRIFTQRIDGTLYGSVYGSLNGNATGSAGKLASPSIFKFTGDVTLDEDVEFDGKTGGLTKLFQTRLDPKFIENQPERTSIKETDEFVFSRQTEGDIGVRKITKADLWKQISKTPVGSIMAFAGATAPRGWLLCDGSEVRISDYTELFNVIGYIYGDINSLLGFDTFKLPDLRGRLALGLDNMNNGFTVPSKVDPGMNISTSGGSANRVTSEYADGIGRTSGSENKLVQVGNLPDHEHNFEGSNGNQYYAIRNIDGTEVPNDEGINGPGIGGIREGRYIESSGGILTNLPLQQPLNVMNPYMAINYIIFTGNDVDVL